MNFNQGDQVVHQDFGVGKVVAIEAMSFDGNQVRLFYRVEFLKTTVWLSVGSQPSRGLRRITPKSKLNRFRALLKSSPVVLDTDFRTRQRELENQIDKGTFRSLCEVVRDISAWNWLKPLNNYEKALLKQSRASLVAEWSITSGLEVGEVLDEIDGFLLIGKQERGIS
jgi:RNA polymerase-interacting CarD/CdnL/TRCF family regulator